MAAGGSLIGKLRVQLGLDSTQFQEGLRGSNAALVAWGKRAAVVAAGVATAGAALGYAVKRSLDDADEMTKAAQRIGIPIQELSKLRYVADLSGVSFENLQVSVRNLSRNMVEAPEKFDALGVSVTNADGSMRSASDVMADMADALNRMPDGAEKSAIAMDLMGRSGTDMIPLLNAGAQSLRDMMAEAEAMGIVITPEMGAAAEAFNDNLSRLRAQMSGVVTVIAAELAPHLADLSEWLVKNGAEVAEFARDIVDATAELVKFAGAVGGAVAPLAAEMPEAARQAELSAGRLKAAFTDAMSGDYSSAGGNIKAFVEDAIHGVDRLIDLLAADGASARARAWVDGIAAGMADLAQVAVEKVGAFTADLAAGMSIIQQQAVGWSKGIVTAISDGLVGLYQAGLNAIAELARGFRESVSGLIEEAKGWGSDIAAGITSGLAGAKEKVMSAGRGLAGWVKGAFTDEAEIQSPSRVFQRFGQFIADGLAIGIEDGKAGPISAMQDLASGIGGVFKGMLLDGKDFGDSMKSMLSGLFSGWASSAWDSGWKGLMGAIGLPSFAGGGFTGYAPRSGGLDGRGGFLAMMHPRETVTDHTLGQAGPQEVRVMVGVDPRNGNITAYADQRVAHGLAQFRGEVPGIVDNHTKRVR